MRFNGTNPSQSSPDRKRRGPLGFSYRKARQIIRSVEEIEDLDRSLFDSLDPQREPPDEKKEARG